MNKGERFINEANEWIEANPKAWDYMKVSAEASAKHGRRFSIGSLCEHVRWEMFSRGTTEFKLNNNHRAAFARRLVEEIPECEPYLTMRKSVCDYDGSDVRY